MELTLVLPDSFIEAVADRVTVLVAGRSDDANENFIDVDEAATYLKVSRRRMYELARLERVPSRKIGASLRFLRSELRPWADQGGDVCP